MDAAKGTSKTVVFSRLESCQSCKGSGSKSGTSPVTCSSCRGSGMETRGRGGFILSSTCRACGGEGKIISTPCPSCNKKGFQQKRTSLNIEIPSGKFNRYLSFSIPFRFLKVRFRRRCWFCASIFR